MKNQTIIASILSTVVIGCHSEETNKSQRIVLPEPIVYEKNSCIDLTYYDEGYESGKMIKQLRDEISSLKIKLANSEENRHNSFNEGLSVGYIRGYGACTEYFMGKMEKDEMSADEAADYVTALMKSRVNASLKEQESK